MTKRMRGMGLVAVVAAGAIAAGCSGAPRSVDDGSTRVVISVTEKGFVPADVTVPAGKPVTMVVTRKTDRTCAKEMVIADRGIQVALPLNQAVEVKFTPDSAGVIRYACGMDMLSGRVTVK
jgi:plastocyanin domain-containing protein